MTDTHTHLYLPEFSIEGQPEGSYEGQCAAVDRAVAAGVGCMIFPNVDLSTIGPMRAVHAMRPDVTYMAMGLHPTEVNETWHEALAATDAEMANHPSDYVAVGEIGIDLYWDRTYETAQMEVFDRQLALASRLDLPVIIHCRDAQDQVLEVLQARRNIKAVFHSFGGTTTDVEAIRRIGDYYFGINGIVTFKNSRVADTIPAIGIDRIVTETDSPYLAPVPYRGKRNESAFITYVNERLSDALGMPPSEISAAADLNARKLFNLTITT